MLEQYCSQSTNQCGLINSVDFYREIIGLLKCVTTVISSHTISSILAQSIQNNRHAIERKRREKMICTQNMDQVHHTGITTIKKCVSRNANSISFRFPSSVEAEICLKDLTFDCPILSCYTCTTDRWHINAWSSKYHWKEEKKNGFIFVCESSTKYTSVVCPLENVAWTHERNFYNLWILWPLYIEFINRSSILSQRLCVSCSEYSFNLPQIMNFLFAIVGLLSC